MINPKNIAPNIEEFEINAVVLMIENGKVSSMGLLRNRAKSLQFA